MNKSKRFLILDKSNVAQNPNACGYSGPDRQGDNSPSFTSKAGAQAFANYIASRQKGQRFYLAEVLAVAICHTEPVPPVQWEDTVAE